MLLLDIAHEMVAFGLQLVDAPLDDVANADNRHQFAIHNDRNVTDSVLGHDPGKLVEAILGGTCLHIAGHDHGNALVQHPDPIGMQMAHHITLADDARHSRAVIADHHSTDMVLLQGFEEPPDRRIRAKSHNGVTFSADHV